MNDPAHPVQPPTAPTPGAGARDAVFRQVALGGGLIDAQTIDRVADPDEALGESLVRHGHLSERGRQAIECLVEERLARDASASTLDSATGAYAPAPPVDPGAPGQTFGEYEIVSELARGGMGIVYKARQARLNRFVALKMIRSGGFASDHEVKRFYAEAQAAGQLDHPGIVPVYEVGEVAGQHFYSMALVQGQSLVARIKERGPLDPRAAAALLKAVADAVSYAHNKGIVHRDLKPHNILLDENDQPRVTDFGLAKHAPADSELTASGQVMGTPSYMPPEQAAGNAAEVGPAADVYSLGATLYCALTGRPPFQASSPAQTLQQVLTEQPTPPRRLNPEIPTDLETICMKCLRKEIPARYASARELADDLARFLAGEPIRARPVGTLERGVKWVRRRPVAAGLLVASVVAVLGLGATAVLAVVQSRLTELNEQLETRNGELDTEKKAAESARTEATTQRDAANRAKRELAQRRYASDVAVAGRAWREGDVGRMSGLLDRLAPKPGEEDLRGFEWYYLRGLERHAVWRLDNVQCALSSDGKLLAVVQNDALELLDPGTRKVLHRLPQPSGAWAFWFSRDGKRVALAVARNEVAVWDAEKGTEVRRLKADDLDVADVAIIDDGALAAARGTGDDHSVRVWDVATGRQLHQWKANGGYPTNPTFSPDGKRLAFEINGTIAILGLRSNAPPITINSPTHRLYGLRFHPSGKWLVGVHDDDAVVVWDAATGQPAKPPFAAGGLRGSTIDFAPDGKFLTTGTTRDNTVCLWDGTTGKLLSTRKGHRSAPASVSILLDGKRVFSRGTDGSNRLWNMEGQQDVDEFPGTAVFPRFSPDPKARVLAFRDQDGRIVLKDGSEDLPLPAKELVSLFEFSADGSKLFAATTAGTCDVWDVRTRQRVHTIKLPGSLAVSAVAVHPGGKWFATVGADHTIRIWDATTYAQLSTFPAPKNGVAGLYFQPGTNNLVTCQGIDGNQIIPLDGAARIEPFRVKIQALRLAFSPDGTRVAIAGVMPNVTVWSFPQFEQIHDLQGHSAMISDVRFSPDGKRLATCSYDDTVRVWDMISGQELLTLPSGYGGWVAFSADGTRLAAGSDTLRIWDSARGRAEGPPIK